MFTSKVPRLRKIELSGLLLFLLFLQFFGKRCCRLDLLSVYSIVPCAVCQLPLSHCGDCCAMTEAIVNANANANAKCMDCNYQY